MKHSAPALLNRLIARGKFRHVQVILQLAELGSVQRTAEAVGLTQPSVTQALASLEDLLEVKLFERHPRGVRPTPICADLLPIARQLLNGLSAGAEAVAARQTQGEGLVRLFASTAAINGVLFDTLLAFNDRFPAIRVHVSEAERDDQLLAIARGEADLVACRRPPVTPEAWEFFALREDRLAVVCRPGHSAARKRSPKWSDLERHEWLLLPTGAEARSGFHALSAAFQQETSTHPMVTRCQPIFWEALRTRNVLALVPRSFAHPLLERGELIEVPVRGPAPALAPLGMLRPSRSPSRAADSLAAFLQDWSRAHKENP